MKGLQKIYDSKQRVTAVDGIDLSVHEGGLFGLLGPNGAGKTTTISICTTRALPTANPFLILGMLLTSLCLLTWIGVKGFLRRVIG